MYWQRLEIFLKDSGRSYEKKSSKIFEYVIQQTAGGTLSR